MTIAHPPEDTLVLHVCGDGTPAERRAIDLHLETCESCRQVAESSAAVLAFSDLGSAPEPGQDFEARMWARIAPALPVAPSPWQMRHVAFVAGWAAVLLVAAWPVIRSAPASLPATSSEAELVEIKERVLRSALEPHWGQTEMLLVELLNAPPVGGSLAFEREIASELVSAGRLYRQTANETGQPFVSLVLDEIEPVLVELARAPDTMPQQELSALQARVTEGDLLFKVRAVARSSRLDDPADQL